MYASPCFAASHSRLVVAPCVSHEAAADVQPAGLKAVLKEDVWRCKAALRFAHAWQASPFGPVCIMYQVCPEVSAPAVLWCARSVHGRANLWAVLCYALRADAVMLI